MDVSSADMQNFQYGNCHHHWLVKTSLCLRVSVYVCIIIIIMIVINECDWSVIKSKGLQGHFTTDRTRSESKHKTKRKIGMSVYRVCTSVSASWSQATRWYDWSSWEWPASHRSRWLRWRDVRWCVIHWRRLQQTAAAEHCRQRQ